MPIITHHSLSLVEHVYPVLAPFAPVFDDRIGGTAEGISTYLGYVTICNSNDLYVHGKQELADYLLEHCKPFGEELKIHFYPGVVNISEKKSFLGALFHRIRMAEIE